MANKTYSDTVDQSLDTAGNWTPSGVPISSDTVTAMSGTVSSGTLVAPVTSCGATIAGGTFADITVDTGFINGGAFNGTTINQNEPITGGTFAGAVTDDNAAGSTGGVFNGTYSSSGSDPSSATATYNGAVTLAAITTTVTGGVFNGTCNQFTATNIVGIATYNNDVILPDFTAGANTVSIGNYNKRISFDNGTTWLYAAGDRPTLGMLIPASMVAIK